MKFYIVDAFSEALFGGNPAGVVLLDEGAPFPTDEIMRKTAAELRYSETVFVKKITKNDIEVRYFTPAAEVDLCGHATIGTFAVLLAAGEIVDPGNYGCQTKAGFLNVQLEQGTIMMEMAPPRWLGELTKEEELQELYTAMGLSAQIWTQERENFSGSITNPRSSSDALTASLPLSCAPSAAPSSVSSSLASSLSPDPVPASSPSPDLSSASSSRLYPALISTGLPDIIMPVASKEILDNLTPDFPLLTALSKKYDVVGVHAFALGDDGVTAYCRNFAPLYDIDEEAATGTSNGALTYYLYQHGIIKESAMNTMIQGEAMNRPSRICSKLHISDKDSSDNASASSVNIQVGGTAVLLASGTIYL